MDSIGISKIINDAREYVSSGRDNDAIAMLGRAVEANPEIADERFSAELALIQDLIICRHSLSESEYVRSFETVYKYCKQVYGKSLMQAKGTEAEAQDMKVSGVKTDASEKNPRAGNEMFFLPDKDKIWWCWLQGYEKAPDIVKICLRSLEKLDREIVILDEHNFSDYVSFPDYIIEAYEKGTLDRTHFSDLIRLELLNERGGLWIDSTVYCSAPDTIRDITSTADLFAYRAVRADNISKYATYDNWLIYASKPSGILKDLRQMLYTYWKNENKLIHYFLFHIFMNIACEGNRDEESRIPVYSTEPCHILQFEMNRPYDSHRFEQILKMSDIHKLTYKHTESKGSDRTNLSYILNEC